MYSINFSKENTNFSLNLNYNGANSYLFVNGKENHKFTAKYWEINPYELCLRNTSKNWSVNNMKKTGLVLIMMLFQIHKVVHIKMFKFIKQIFVSTLMFFRSLPSVNPLECVSMNNEKCTRPETVTLNSNDHLFCSGSCNDINYPHAWICVPDIVKNLNVKVFNLLSRTDETRHIKWHETYKCEWKYGENVFNNKQILNKDKCRCECKES